MPNSQTLADARARLATANAAEPSGTSADAALVPPPEGSVQPPKCRSCSGYGRAENGGYCSLCARNRFRPGARR